MSVGILDLTRSVALAPQTPAGRQTGDVEIYSLEDARLEVRYYDEPGRFRRWTIPLQYAGDLASWWNTSGRTQHHSDRTTAETRYGAINVAILSTYQIYFRGRSPLGRPNVTGFQLPRPAVEALCAYYASQATGSGTSVLSFRSGQPGIPYDLRSDV